MCYNQVLLGVHSQVLRQPGCRAGRNDFELEEDRDKVAPLPTVVKAYNYLPSPFVSRTSRWVVKAERTRGRNYRKGLKMKEGG